MRKAAKTPCKECPFRRTSAAGWLGNTDAAQFMRTTVDMEADMPCHMTVDYEDTSRDYEERLEEGRRCAGSLIFLKNSCKLPRNAELAAAVDAVTVDRETIFAHRQQFMEHHDTAAAKKRTKRRKKG